MSEPGGQDVEGRARCRRRRGHELGEGDSRALHVLGRVSKVDADPHGQPEPAILP